ncbi:15801_t:CDS:2, partial [Gigaspora margarita]
TTSSTTSSILLSKNINNDDYTVEVDCNPNKVTFTCKSSKVKFICKKHEEDAAEEVKKDFSEIYYYIVSYGNPDLGMNFDDDSSSFLKLHPFKDNTNAQWKIQRADNSEDSVSLTDNSSIKDVILINKKTGKAMKYQKQESGAEITQVDPAETDNKCSLWTISSKQDDGSQFIYLNNTEDLCLDGWTGNLLM